MFGPSRCLIVPTILAFLASFATAGPDEHSTSQGRSQPAEQSKPKDCWLETIDLGLGFGLSSKDALYWQSTDGQIKIKAGGRIQWDYGWLGGDAVRDDTGQDIESQGEFRRLWFYVSGDLAEMVDFKFEFDFAETHILMEDFYIRLKQLPILGNLQLGHFEEPFNLEELVSNKYVTFIERGLPNVFAPAYNWGIMAQNTAFDERMTWAVGAFRAYVNNDFGRWGSSSQGEACAMTGRVTFLPLYEESGRELIHLGAAYSIRRPEGTISFSQRPEAHMVPKLTNTGRIDADRVHLLGGEAAWVHGPLSLQGEYIAAAVDAAGGQDDLWFNSMYVQASYFLTGEHRPYDTKNGFFTGIKPKKNFLTGGGPGAWELATRLSYLDLNEGDVASTASRMLDFTCGVNWYLNPNLRISGNYIRSCINGSLTSDAADIFLVRLQVAF